MKRRQAMKEETWWLSQTIGGSSYNIFNGTLQECEEEYDKVMKREPNAVLFISCNRYD